MEKRLSKRIPVRLEAYIFSGNKTYAGFIENISESGFQYLIISSFQNPQEFKSDKIIQIYFQLPSGETLKLFCDVKWYIQNSPNDKTLLIGVEILDPPPQFKEFIKTLDIVNVN